MNVIHIFLWIIFIAINVFFALQFLLPIILFIFHFILPKSPQKLLKRYRVTNDKEFDFAAIITAHQDARFIMPLVDSLLKQKYENYVIYVVADDCDIRNLQINDPKVVMLKPQIALHAKIKSIKYAVDRFIRDHDALIIFDSDNLAHPNFLSNLNQYFQRGFKVVQANMLSKNLDSSFARLDALGHTYHNFLERQVKMELGITSSILGLGLAIDMNIYKEVVFKNELGGFDKKLQVHLTLSVPAIAYAKDVLVYDEKVESGAAFEKQRTRWIYTYFEYFNDSIYFLRRSLKNFNAGRLLLAFNMLRPPMFMTISMALVCMALWFFIRPLYGWLWLALLLLYTINFILIATTQSQQKGISTAFFFIPAMVFRQFRSLFRIKQAKKSFLKTEHQKVIYIKELLDNGG